MVSVILRQKLIALHKFEICTKLKKTGKGDHKNGDFFIDLKKSFNYAK